MSAIAYKFEEIAPLVESALRKAFVNNSIVEIEEGYLGRVRAKVVSAKFNGRTEQEKQAMVWEALQAELGSDATAVSYVMTYGTDEL